MADLLVHCTGGTPVAAGQPLPQADLTLVFGTAVTSRQFVPGWSEAPLLVDDPARASHSACATAGGVCTVTGTGDGHWYRRRRRHL